MIFSLEDIAEFLNLSYLIEPDASQKFMVIKYKNIMTKNYILKEISVKYCQYKMEIILY